MPAGAGLTDLRLTCDQIGVKGEHPEFPACGQAGRNLSPFRGPYSAASAAAEALSSL